VAAKQKVELQAKKLADAKRKLAELEAQVENIRRAQMHTNDENEQAPNHKFSKSHHQIKNNNLRQQIHLRQEHNLRQYQSNIPFDPNSPLSVALKQTTWPLGYKPAQIQWIGGSNPVPHSISSYNCLRWRRMTQIMATSFVMAKVQLRVGIYTFPDLGFEFSVAYISK